MKKYFPQFLYLTATVSAIVVIWAGLVMFIKSSFEFEHSLALIAIAMLFIGAVQALVKIEYRD